VGYRVNSQRGVHFRKWATSILKDYLLKGYAHNEKLLREKQTQPDALKQAMALITKVAGSQALSGDQAVKSGGGEGITSATLPGVLGDPF
jgi:hypothetical protein